MATIEQIYDFEGAIEEAFKFITEQRFAAVQLHGVGVYTSRDPFELEPPYVDFVLSGGPPLSQRTSIGQAVPRMIPKSFTGTLVANVVTVRHDSRQRALHQRIRSELRYVLSGANGQISAIHLPFHQIVELLPSGWVPEVDTEKKTDATQHAYAVTWSIKDDAWPATP